MKKKDLLLMAVVFILFSCCSNESDKYDKPSALCIKSVYSVSEKADAGTYSLVDWKESVDTGEEYNEYEKKPDALWSTGDNIKWYNGTTGELKFITEPRTILPREAENPPKLVVFLDGKKLLSFDGYNGLSSIYAPNWPSIGLENDGLYYIGKGFPRWLDPEKRPDNYDDLIVGREENWKAIEPEWNIFIEQLKKEGKFIE